MQLGEAQEFRLVELARRLSNVVRPGVVAEADYALARVRVQYGGPGAVTGWLPWLAARAGGDHSWWAPEIGEQVLILAPSGELSNGIVLAGLYQSNRPAPSDDPDKRLVRYSDGAEIEYDRAAHRLRAVLPEGGAAEITAPDGVTITGDVAITGDVTVTGGLDATGDVTSDSRLFELLDAPLTPGTLTEIYAEAAEALARWETRLRVDRIKATAVQGRLDGGKVLIDLEGVYLPDGETVRIEGIVV